MEIKRKDVFEFVLVLTESEFAEVKVSADEDEMSIEDKLLEVIEYALEKC